MKSYSEVSESVFPKNVLRMYSMARKIVARIEDANGKYKGLEDRWIRCHEVARIVHELLKPKWETTVVDGRYGTKLRGSGVDHSWLVYSESPEWATRNSVTGAEDRFILDVYAIARLPMVQLVSTDIGHRLLYTPLEGRNDINESFVRQQVQQIRKYVWQVKL